MTEIKNNTHFIIKCDDVKYLSKTQSKHLLVILARIASCRMREKKNPINDYYICNKDEPYADEVLKVILRGEDAKVQE